MRRARTSSVTNAASLVAALRAAVANVASSVSNSEHQGNGSAAEVFDDTVGAQALCHALERILAHGVLPQYALPEKPPSPTSSVSLHSSDPDGGGGSDTAATRLLKSASLIFSSSAPAPSLDSSPHSQESAADVARRQQRADADEEAMRVASTWRLIRRLPSCLPGGEAVAKGDMAALEKLCPALFVAKTALEHTRHNSPLAKARIFVRAALNDGSFSELLCALVYNDLGLIREHYGGDGAGTATERPLLSSDSLLGEVLDVLAVPPFSSLQFQFVVRDEDLDQPDFYLAGDVDDDHEQQVQGSLADDGSVSVPVSNTLGPENGSDPSAPLSGDPGPLSGSVEISTSSGLKPSRRGKKKRTVITLESPSPRSSISRTPNELATNSTLGIPRMLDMGITSTSSPPEVAEGQGMGHLLDFSPPRHAESLSTPKTPMGYSDLDNDTDSSFITMDALPAMYSSGSDEDLVETGLHVAQQSQVVGGPSVSVGDSTNDSTVRKSQQTQQANTSTQLESLRTSKSAERLPGTRGSSFSGQSSRSLSSQRTTFSGRSSRFDAPPSVHSLTTRNGTTSPGIDAQLLHGTSATNSTLTSATLLHELDSSSGRTKRRDLLADPKPRPVNSQGTSAWAQLVEAEWGSKREDSVDAVTSSQHQPQGEWSIAGCEEYFEDYAEAAISQRAEGVPNLVVVNDAYRYRECRTNFGPDVEIEAPRREAKKFEYEPLSTAVRDSGRKPSTAICEKPSCTEALSTGLFVSALFCYYCGLYCCRSCHQAEKLPIPGLVVKKLDRRPHPVCVECAHVLDFYFARPALTNISRLNPEIFTRQPLLERVHALRMQLLLIVPFILSCARDRDKLIRLLVGPTKVLPRGALAGPGGRRFSAAIRLEHKEKRLTSNVESPSSTPTKKLDIGADRLCDRSYMLFRPVDRYSLADLVLLQHLPATLELVLERFILHVTEECNLCASRGHFCSLCGEDDLVFPFQVGTVYVCTQCRACYHKKCIPSEVTFSCPNCVKDPRLKRGRSSSTV